MKLFHHYALPVLAALLLGSCVSTKKYNELLDEKNKCDAKNEQLEKSNRECNTFLNECTGLKKKLQQDLESANIQLDTLNRNYMLTRADLTELQQAYEGVNKNYKGAVAGRDQLSRELSLKESELAAKEAELSEKEELLASKEKLIHEQADKLTQLQGILDAQQNQMNELKEKISQALLGFQDKGLTVTTRNGKVYVSVDEKLLFASGKWSVDPQGRPALYEIAQVMAKNPDIQVVVEGHTDKDRFVSKNEVKDNWDLSVMRATSIVKILLDNPGVNPRNVSAAGRGEFFPVDEGDTKEAKAKNRRIEIILTPDLDSIYKLIEK